MRKLLPLAACAVLLLSACKNDDEVLPDPHHNSVLSMAMHWHFGTEAFHPDSLYTDDFGHVIEVDEVRFYLSRIWFNNDVGDSVAGFPDKYFLIDASEGGLIRTIGEVDAHLHEIHMDFGLDSAANYSDPTTASAPLNIATMWWGWADGRVFARINGKVDLDGDGVMTAADGAFTYDCGTMPLRRNAVIEVHTDADIGSNVILDFDVDVQRMLQGVDVVSQPFTHTTDNLPLATLLMENLSHSITHP